VRSASSSITFQLELSEPHYLLERYTPLASLAVAFQLVGQHEPCSVRTWLPRTRLTMPYLTLDKPVGLDNRTAVGFLIRSTGLNISLTRYGGGTRPCATLPRESISSPKNNMKGPLFHLRESPFLDLFPTTHTSSSILRYHIHHDIWTLAGRAALYGRGSTSLSPRGGSQPQQQLLTTQWAAQRFRDLHPAECFRHCAIMLQR
jgi:hypothetical protein